MLNSTKVKVTLERAQQRQWVKLRGNSYITGPMGMEGRCALYRGASNMLDLQILWLTKILVVKVTSASS